MIEYIVMYCIPAFILAIVLAVALLFAHRFLHVTLGTYSEVSSHRAKAVEQLTEVIEEMRTETASHMVEMQSLRNTVTSMKPVRLPEPPPYEVPKRKVVIQ